MKILKLLFTSSRPLSWVNTAFPFAAGYIILTGKLDPTFWIGTLFFLIPYNLLMYGLNDVFDYESDMRNPRKGGVEGAVLPKKYHRSVILASTLLPLPFMAWLLINGSFFASSILVVVLFFVIAYSAKGLRFKEVPVLDSITSSLHFVGPLLYAMALAGFSAAAWPYLVAFFLWGIASHAFGAIQDIIPDRTAKLRSIATIFGARTVVYLAATSYAVAAIILAVQDPQLVAVAFCGVLYLANTLDFVTITDTTSATARTGWKRFLWMNYLTGAVVTITMIVWN